MKNKGLKTWEHALQIIPGGNGLLSKRPERYAPDLWPSYFKNCKGVEVEDLEGNRFIDMAQMGIGTSILGYADEELNEAVLESIKAGVNCTLNCVEEIELAELLLKHNEFADQVKFARSGGEAMEVAVRIARAYSGKEKVAFSGYHGWCDWYLSSNLSNKDNLNEQLLPGLEPIGVPSSLKGTTIPFLYNNVDDFLEKIDRNPDIGIICIEGARYDYPTNEFIETIMKKAKENNIILMSNFNYQKQEKIFKSIGSIKIKDKLKNEYNFSQIYIDTEKEEIIGSDVSAFLNDDNFKVDKKITLE